jgi:adenosine deaminase
MSRPLIVLHDHLDGGLRPETVLELCAIPLPFDEAGALAGWFDQRGSGSLERYLDAFVYTLAAMGTPEALRRVAREAVEDHAAAGVIHAELRFGPLLLPSMTPEVVVESVLAGLQDGSDATGVTTGLILCALRHLPDSEKVARLAGRYAGQGVVGFDLAGPERGFPPDDHLPAIHLAREAGLGLTLHAGEAGGVDSIRRAVDVGGADRIGHGVEIIEDCVVSDGVITDVGPVATTLLERRIPLEICPSSNLATKGWTVSEHPLALLHRAGFVVTLNTDNRLMSATTMSQEAELALDGLGLAPEELAEMTRNAAATAFLPERERSRLLRRLDQ